MFRYGIGIERKMQMSCPDPLHDYEDWDPIMGEADEWIDTDDEWLDEFCGEEEFA